MMTRREMITKSSAALAGSAFLTAVQRAVGAEAPPTAPAESKSDRPGQPGDDYTPVIAPNAIPLPWKLVGGVKVFHMIAEEVEHEFAPGLKAICWGYNGRVHGPVIEAVEGDRVRIYVTNRLPAATTVHWHGVLLPNGMDGVGGSTSARSSRARRSSTNSRSSRPAR